MNRVKEEFVLTEHKAKHLHCIIPNTHHRVRNITLSLMKHCDALCIIYFDGIRIPKKG